jgi:hypothetical protein
MSKCHRKKISIKCSNDIIFTYKIKYIRKRMKKLLFAGILLLGMTMSAIAEENDDLDEFSDESSPMEIIQDFMDDCNDAKDYYGCFSVAMKYEKGEVLEKDITKAIEYYDKACKYGSEEGCKMAKKLQEQAK